MHSTATVFNNLESKRHRKISNFHKTLAIPKRTIKLASVVSRLYSMRNSQKHRPVIAALLLGCLLAIQAMAAFPALHLLVHRDAADADHECAVTLFAHGQVEAASTTIPLLPAAHRVVHDEALPRIIFVSTDILLLPSRGPPASPALA